ncbi:MAG: SAM-dependent methyltransferase [Bacteroidetes bacterium]|nr:MAG: SAM-dependent methyltransferase [Bacteroidota bacterium]
MSPSFKYRSVKDELLDQPDIPQQDLFRNLFELDKINRMLGGHSATLQGIQSLITDKSKVYKVIDLGCGGGDTLLAINGWAKRNGYKVELTGVDILKDAIQYASVYCAEIENWTLIQSDFEKLPKWENEYDIAICSLFCHHLYGETLKSLIKTMHRMAKIGVVINDLHRHPLAYYSILFLTRILSKSKYVLNDAPLSVLRGFTKPELVELLDGCDIEQHTVEWKWAFRYLIVIRK